MQFEPLFFDFNGPTRDMRNTLLDNMDVLVKISDFIYTGTGESFKNLFPKGMTCALVPYAVPVPCTIFDISRGFTTKEQEPIVAIFEPYIMDRVKELCIKNRMHQYFM